MKIIYVIEYRHVKKNVEKFGLKEWYEGVVEKVPVTNGLSVEALNPKQLKVIESKRIKNERNSIIVFDKKKRASTRPSTTYTDIKMLFYDGLQLVPDEYINVIYTLDNNKLNHVGVFIGTKDVQSNKELLFNNNGNIDSQTK